MYSLLTANAVIVWICCIVVGWCKYNVPISYALIAAILCRVAHSSIIGIIVVKFGMKKCSPYEDVSIPTFVSIICRCNSRSSGCSGRYYFSGYFQKLVWSVNWELCSMTTYGRSVSNIIIHR